jgi:hypothetical protein
MCNLCAMIAMPGVACRHKGALITALAITRVCRCRCSSMPACAALPRSQFQTFCVYDLSFYGSSRAGSLLSSAVRTTGGTQQVMTMYNDSAEPRANFENDNRNAHNLVMRNLWRSEVCCNACYATAISSRADSSASLLTPIAICSHCLHLKRHVDHKGLITTKYSDGNALQCRPG